MNNLNLPNPKMMDVAVPANMRVGLRRQEIARRGWAVSAARSAALGGAPDVTLVDLRERTEREKHGIIAGSLHAPIPTLRPMSGPAACCTSSPRHRQAHHLLLRLRRALGHGRAGRAGCWARLSRSHQGGIDAWKKAGGPLVR